MNDFADVPTIDVSPLGGDDLAATSRVADAIDGALRGSGFFYASGHGIDVERLQNEVDDFHRTMTDEEKHRIAIRAYNPANHHIRNGYYMAIEGRKAVESFCYLNPTFTDDHPVIRAGLPMHEVNWWPDEVAHPTFRPFCEHYFSEMLDLSRRLLRGVALALGQPEQLFDPHVVLDDTLSAVSLIRYPRLDDYPPVTTGPDGVKLSFEDHKDISMLTVLFQTPVQNLQVETADGWLDITPSAHDFLVNCGTYLEHLTNGHYPAPVHRVTWVNAERLSIPFFLHAGYQTILEPFVPEGSAVSGGNRPILYGDYVRHGLQALIDKNGQT